MIMMVFFNDTMIPHNCDCIIEVIIGRGECRGREGKLPRNGRTEMCDEYPES